MPLPKCSDCDNWRRRNPGATDGTCHLRPPVVVPDNSRHGAVLHVWPVTLADDGCRLGFLERRPPALDDGQSALVELCGGPVGGSMTTPVLRRAFILPAADSHG